MTAAVPVAPNWESQILYAVFVPRKDKAGKEIEDFEKKLENLVFDIKKKLKALTKIKTTKGEGHTEQWAALRCSRRSSARRRRETRVTRCDG